MTRNVPEFNFDDLQPLEQAFKFGGVDYIVTEASTEAAKNYRIGISKGATYDGTKVTVSDLSPIVQVEEQLVADCLFTTDANGQRKSADRTVVKKFPGRLTSKLFNWIKAVSELDEAQDEADGEHPKLDDA